MGAEPKTWLRRLEDYRAGRRAVDAWRQFAHDVRSRGCSLLERIDDFPGAVLVAGCQRSGTTMLARLITASDGMFDYYSGPDDEHDAAMLLAGCTDKPGDGRYCFQTTYLNECVGEYLVHADKVHLVWVVRNPNSVVYSLLYNWSRFALNELFAACGLDHLDDAAQRRYQCAGLLGVSRLEKACAAYAGKTAQILSLRDQMPQDRLLVVEYDRLVRYKAQQLPKVYEFIGLAYREDYAAAIHARSLDKQDKLSARERHLIERVCRPVYERVLEVVDL